MNKHVESIWSPCLDAGSIPASSTDQAENKHPRKGVIALRKPLKACFHKVCEKAKIMRSMGFVFYLQD